jgi:2-dehydropantoate 2-reductase
MVQSLADGHAESETSGSKQISNALLDALLDADILQPELLTPAQILEAQLEKLVINSVINPLTALKGCKNGEVFNGQDGDSDCRVLVREAGAIVRELLRRRSAGAAKGSATTGRDFSDPALLEAVRRVASATAGNTSSMLQDVRAGRETEIDFINGYLVRQAEVLGLPCERHKELVARVKEIRG